MKPKSLRLLAPAAVYLLAASDLARASVVLDSITTGSLVGTGLNITGPSATLFIGFPIPYEDRESAFSFQTGPNTATLGQVEFQLNAIAGGLDPVEVTLSTGLNAPGGDSPITVGSYTPSSVGSHLASITPSATLNLAANSVYWLHFTSPSGNSVYSLSGNNSLVATSGWSIDSVDTFAPSSGWTDVSGTTPSVRLNATVVPEPTIILISSFGLLLLLQRRDRGGPGWKCV